jgi:phage terminase Nu1 subunit (DNA packaging protein)
MPLDHHGGRGGRDRHSRYDAIACAEWVRRHRPGMVDAQQERARLDSARREEIEIRTRRRLGELVPAAATEALLSRLILSARTAFLALPTRIAATFQAVDRGMIQAIDAEVRQILTDLADGVDPAREGVTPKASA